MLEINGRRGVPELVDSDAQTGGCSKLQKAEKG
jgi:hypothetical protein